MGSGGVWVALNIWASFTYFYIRREIENYSLNQALNIIYIVEYRKVAKKATSAPASWLP